MPQRQNTRAGKQRSQGVRDHSPSLSLREFAESQFTADQLRRVRVCCSHLERSLDRSVTIDDLNRVHILDVLEHLSDEGRKPATLNRLISDFRLLAQGAVTAGLLRSVPTLPKLTTIPREASEPWPVMHLTRLLLSAQSLPRTETVATIPAGKFWTALILVQVDTGLTVAESLNLKVTEFNLRRGTLAHGLLIYELYPLTIEAVHALSPFLQSSPDSSTKLFPWDKDNGEPPFYMLYRKLKELLFRADLPYISRNLFERLRITGRLRPEILNRLNLNQPFVPKPGKPHFPRSKERNAYQRPRKERQSTAVLPCSALSSRSLETFYEQDYRVVRLANKAKSTIGDYRTMLRRLSEFTGFAPTFADLNEERAEHFLAWLARNELAAETVNKYRAMLLAPWRHAWRRKKVADLPRDVTKQETTKRNPEAWSQEELADILAAAREQTGIVGGLPAADWWFALLLTLYETGLRIQATLELKTTDLDFKSGWLTIPADHQKQKAEQVYPLHAETLEALLRTEPQQRIQLFPCSMQPGTLRKQYREILQRAGLPHGRRDLFHKLRRTSATFVANAIDEDAAQKHMGHSHINVTRKYLDLRKIKRIHLVDVLPRPELHRHEGVA